MRSSATASVIHTTVPLPSGTRLTRERIGPSRTEIALAPDGSYLVFSASPDGSASRAMLFRRFLNRAEATPIAGTEGARAPFFSPDGQWLGFWAKGKLYRVAATGGIPDPICDVRVVPFGVSWGLDGKIIFGSETTGLQRVSADGGKPETMVKIDSSNEASLGLPLLLPGGKAVAFTVKRHRGGAEARIEVLSLEAGRRKPLIDDAADARYLPTGHVVFLRRGALMAAPLDLDRLEITGPTVTVAAGVMQALNEIVSNNNSGAGQYAVSESGTLVYASGGIFPDPEYPYSWVDRSGRAEPWTAFGKRPATGLRLSPDGRSAVFFTVGLNADLWVYDLQRDTATKLTSDGRTLFPAWTPDGKRVAFGWSRAGAQTIWWKPWDGSAEMEQLTKSEFGQSAGSWTPDGKYLAMVEQNPSTGLDILVLRMEDRQLIRFATTSSSEAWPEFSPDGRWLAYSSNESGRYEIYLRSFPGGNRRLTISNQGGMVPLWAPDGRELFYWNLESTKLMKVDIFTGRELSAGTPKVLIEFAAQYSSPIRDYNITQDGRRFLFRGRPEQFIPTEVTQLNLVQNWFEELKRLVPTSKN